LQVPTKAAEKHTAAVQAAIRILIAEDHLIARAGIGAIVNAQADMEVVAEATNGEQAVSLYQQHAPDVTLMDMRMPGSSGLQAIAEIRAGFPDARIIALSTFGGDEDIRRALHAGAQAYLTKDVLHDDLIGAIRAVHTGQQYLTPSVIATLASETEHPDLSARELEVLRLIAEGLTNKQIACRLLIAEDTVKNHIKSIFKKLGTDDRTLAATKSIQRGIIHLQN
jgi:two-component system NarL family response regulator